MTYDTNSLKEWIFSEFYPMNVRALREEFLPEEMVSIVNHHALMDLPAIDTLNTRKAWQILTLLGILATSVERHTQQAVRRQSTSQEVIPGQGIAKLFINGKQPFLEYFQALAARLNHPPRDSFITYIEMNGPCTEVMHPATNQPLYRLGNLFEDDSFLTFTGNIQEEEFITLLKKSVSLQGAANLLMEEALNHPEGIQSQEAIQAFTTAATFMFGIRDLIADFIQRSPISADFFLDEFRQYAIRWYADRNVKASSAANDDSALLRDLILFTELVPPREGFKGFRSHVQETYHVMLPDAVARLELAMNRESLEVLISQVIQLDLKTLLTLNEGEIAEMLQKHPWLAACLVLYRAQSEASKAHFSTIMKYMVWPKRKRDKASDPREKVTVVPNVRGSTGMEPMGIMTWLDRSRAQHPLAVVGHRLSVVQLCSNILNPYISHPIEIPFDELVTFTPTGMHDLMRPHSVSQEALLVST